MEGFLEAADLRAAAQVLGGARPAGFLRARGGVAPTELSAGLPLVGAGVVGAFFAYLGRWGRGELGLAVLADRTPRGGAGDTVDREPRARL